MSLRYLLDEHVAHALQAELSKKDPTQTVRMIGQPDTPALGAKDPELLLWCELNGYVLVTNNRASMPRHLRDHLAAGHRMPGIFMLNPSMSLSATAEHLLFIAGISSDDDHRDRIQFLPLV